MEWHCPTCGRSARYDRHEHRFVKSRATPNNDLPTGNDGGRG